MGDVAEVIGGGTPRTSEASYFEKGDIPWLTPADLSGYDEKFIGRGRRNITRLGLAESSARLMPSGTVLFTSRAPIGYVAIAANPMATNQGFKSFVLRDSLNPGYIYYYLQFATPIITEFASGTTFLEISGQNAKKIPVPVAPKREQRRGVELVDGVSRLCAMNLFLHGIGPEDNETEPPIKTDDSLRNEPGTHFPLVITNPPFGKKSSITIVNEEGESDNKAVSYSRPDFWTTTTNKQLNFVQHIKSLLAVNGRAAVVLPDNVLFEGGAGETVRRKLMHECDLHTILRLPTGIFYANGVKANVLFFDRRPANATPWTREVWFYDQRTNKRFTLKQNRMTRQDLAEFVACYQPDDRHNRTATWSEDNPDGRWRCYGYDEIINRDKASLDIFWLRDESLEDSADLPDPNILAVEIAEDLESALEQIKDILGDLEERAEPANASAG